MDHGGGHAGHGDMPMGPRCSMNMLWNTQIINTCIVFPQWHIYSHTGFVISCLAIVGLSVLYEYLRLVQKKYDIHVAQQLVASGKGKARSATPSASGRNSPEIDYEESGLLSGRKALKAPIGTPLPPVTRAIRASLYGATVFLSFFLMLVFMTYNAYLIAAVVVGAAIGHYVFGSTMNVNAVLSDATAPRGMACH